MIKTLTDEQRELIPVYRDKWIKIGLNCDPCDFVQAKKAAALAYQCVNLPPPDNYILAGGPVSAAAIAAILKKSVNSLVGNPVIESVVTSARTPIGKLIKESTTDSFRASIRDSVTDLVWDSVRGSVGGPIWDSVWNSFGDSAMRARDSAEGPIWAPVWEDLIGDSVWDLVKDATGGKIWSKFDDSIEDSVWDSVRASIREPVAALIRDPIWDPIWTSARGSIGGSIWDALGTSGHGSHDAPWLSMYDYYTSVCGLELPKVQGLLDLAHHCGWWIPYDKLVILQHRHKTLRRDEQGRLHCENGRAVEYSDGWGLSAWHGTIIPDEWVTGSPPTPQDALYWKFIEQRRAVCEIVGWDKIIQSLNARVINTHDNPQIGTLLEADIPDSGKERFLQVQCGTGRTFVIPVPPTVQTALEANAMTYGLTPTAYNPEVRT